jgi:uncharacterized membrane protein YoaK (UPF0700 family)
MMHSSSTGGNPTAEKIAPYVLLGMTAVTGLVDAVSFLSLGSVFTANMTGNILVFLSAASFCSIGYRSDLLEHSFQPLVLIAFTGLAMGTRNAVVRKLAIPDLTTTVLTLTVTGCATNVQPSKSSRRPHPF